MKENFQVLEFFSDRSHDGNILARIHNNVVRAINEEILFPKAILMVLDGDIVKYAPLNKEGAETFLGKIVNNMVESLHELMNDHKGMMSDKAKKYKYLSFLWMVPPEHRNFNDNDSRASFAAALESSVMKFNEMRFLKLKTWEINDGNNVALTNKGYKFTARGLVKYWKAVDAALQYWESTQKRAMSTSRNFKTKNFRNQKWNKQ